MNKHQLLLKLAVQAANWPEGTRYEVAALLHGAGTPEVYEALEEHYPEYFADKDKWSLDKGKWPFAFAKCYSQEFYDKVQKDVTELLELLAEQCDL